MTIDTGRAGDKGDAGASNRGHRASHTANGDVVGSGASAGGGGAEEDYDSESQLGNGLNPSGTSARKPAEGGDAGDGG